MAFPRSRRSDSSGGGSLNGCAVDQMRRGAPPRAPCVVPRTTRRAVRRRCYVNDVSLVNTSVVEEFVDMNRDEVPPEPVFSAPVARWREGFAAVSTPRKYRCVAAGKIEMLFVFKSGAK